MSETIVTDPVTGGQKASKPEQLGAVDPTALRILGRVAAMGAEKYETWNFLKGFDWALAFNAMQRHVMAFWEGEDLDPESGLPHMAHAAWHALCLVSFQQRELGTDTRYVQETSGDEDGIVWGNPVRIAMEDAAVRLAKYFPKGGEPLVPRPEPVKLIDRDGDTWFNVGDDQWDLEEDPGTNWSRRRVVEHFGPITEVFEDEPTLNLEGLHDGLYEDQEAEDSVVRGTLDEHVAVMDFDGELWLRLAGEGESNYRCNGHIRDLGGIIHSYGVERYLSYEQVALVDDVGREWLPVLGPGYRWQRTGGMTYLAGDMIVVKDFHIIGDDK